MSRLRTVLVLGGVRAGKSALLETLGLLRAALACYTDMATFKEAGVSERLP